MSRQHHRSGRYTPPKRPTRATWVPPGVGPFEHWVNLGCTCQPQIDIRLTTDRHGKPVFVIEAGHHTRCKALARINASEN